MKFSSTIIAFARSYACTLLHRSYLNNCSKEYKAAAVLYELVPTLPSSDNSPMLPLILKPTQLSSAEQHRPQPTEFSVPRPLNQLTLLLDHRTTPTTQPSHSLISQLTTRLAPTSSRPASLVFLDLVSVRLRAQLSGSTRTYW